MKGDKQVTLVLRKSGHVDLYWNCKRITSTEESEEPQVYFYTSITMSFNAAYLNRQVSPAAEAAQNVGNFVDTTNLTQLNPSEMREHSVLLELN